MADHPNNAGLSGITVGETRIASLTPEQLTYRGYPIDELAEAACFEEVVHLLVFGELPARRALAQLRDTLMEFRRLPLPVLEALRAVPTDAPLMDVLRSMISLAGHYDPTGDYTLDDRRRRALWLLATTASLATARYRFAHRETIVPPQPGLSYAAQLLHQFRGDEPSEPAAKLLDKMLVLVAEHGFAPSTFATRVIASTGTDMVSGVCGAIGALKGLRHGGGCELVRATLDGVTSRAEAAGLVQRAITERTPVPGFGHRVYVGVDPRARVLEAAARAFATEPAQQRLLDVYDALCGPMIERKGLHPNLEMTSALAFRLLGLPDDLHLPVFVAGRTAGWCAHFIEQVQLETPLAPQSRYVGESPRPVPPIEAR